MGGGGGGGGGVLLSSFIIASKDLEAIRTGAWRHLCCKATTGADFCVPACVILCSEDDAGDADAGDGEAEGAEEEEAAE